MEKGPTEYAAEHASAVAREVVRLGLAEVEPVRKCFQEYNDLLKQHGPRGTFTQLLLVRGVVDRGGFDRLQTAVPPDVSRLQGTGSAHSQVFRLPPGTLPAPAAAAPVAVLSRPNAGAPAKAPVEGEGGERTMEFGAVIPSTDPDAEEAGGRTMSFQAVLPPPPKGGSIEDAIGSGLGSSDELAAPMIAPPPKPEPSRPASNRLGPPPRPGSTRPGSSPSSPSSQSGRSAKTPDPVASAPRQDDEEQTVSMREDEVFEVPKTATPSASGPPRVRSTADSRTPSHLGEALDLVPVEVKPAGSGYALGAPSQDDASGSEFYMSEEVEQEESKEQAPSEPQVGQVLGGHELVKVLGRGGMGVIYIAKKAGQEQVVALKVLLGTNDPGADRRRQRFRAEFEALRRLDHPNIVKVFDLGREGGFDWYTMQFVEGKDFEKLLLEGSMEPSEKLDVFGEVCQALGHAHERNVVHRDVKPQNVLVDAKGHAHVLDFGLAKILDQGVGMTRTGSSLGTPFYMAPEQLKSAKHVDARADVFALGVMLYEITTGVRPFPGETAAEVGQRILNDDPERPSKVKKGVHPDLDAICLRALEKEPERRYADASELYEDVLRFQKGFGVRGAKASQGAAAELRRWAVRNRAGIIGGLVASGLLVPALILVLAMKGSGGGKDGGKTTEASPTATAVGPAPTSDTSAKPPDPATVAPPKPATEAPKPVTEKAPDTTPGETTQASGTTEKKPPPPPPPVTEAPRPAAKTPADLARAALAIPDERPGSGGEQAQSAHTTSTAQRTLLLGFEGGVAPAMAVGDTDRALEALRALRGTAGLSISELALEVEDDVKTLVALRALAGARFAEGSRGRSPELFGGERLRGAAPSEPLEGGWLRKDEACVLDPLAFDLATLRAWVIDPKVDHPPVRYALAVLGIYRGLKESQVDADLSACPDAVAVQRRRKLAAWYEQARKDVWDALEAEAADAWRALKVGAPRLDALQEYPERLGRTAAFRERRAEWLEALAARRTWVDLVSVKPKGNQPQLTWPLKKETAGDFELVALKDDGRTPFRAEAQTAAVLMDGGRLAFELDDLVGSTATLEVGADGPVNVHFGPLLQEIDPDNAWVVKVDGRQVGVQDKKRAMSPPKPVVFERNEVERVFRVATATAITVPLAQAGGRWPGTFVGVQAQGEARLNDLTFSWRDDENPQRAAKLTRRLLERDLLQRLTEPARKDGQLLLRLDPARPTALLLDGAWTAQPGGLAGGRGAWARLAAWADVGVLRFELATDDGPCTRLWLRPTNASSGGMSWVLPTLLKPDLDEFRQVTVLFDLKAKSIAVLVDGLRLKTPPFNVPQGGVFALEAVDRTRVKLRSLELHQLGPRAGLRP